MAKKESTYGLEFRNGLYYLTENGEYVTTPKLSEVSTKSEKLAKMLVDCANRSGIKYTQPTDIFNYLYSTLDFAMYWDDEDREQQIARMLWLLETNQDAFLMFRQSCPMWPPVAKNLHNYLSMELPTLPPHRLMCYVILSTTRGSVALAQYIISEILEADGDYDELKDDFLDDLKEYCAYNGLRFNRRQFSTLIDRFTFYFTLDEV